MEKWQFKNRLSALNSIPSPFDSELNVGTPNEIAPMGMGGEPSPAPPTPDIPKLNNPVANLNMNYPTPALDDYQKFLGQAPNPENYKPGFGRKLIAGLTGLASNDPIKTQGEILDAPYDKAMGNFYTQAKLKGEAANIEEKNISNKKGIAYNEARMNLMEQANQLKSDHEKFLREKSDSQREVAWAKIQKDYDTLAQRYDLAIQDSARKGANSDQLAAIARERLALTQQKMQFDNEYKDRKMELDQQKADDLARRIDAYVEYVRRGGDPKVVTELLEPTPTGGQKKTTTTVIGGGANAYKGVAQPQPKKTQAKVRMIAPNGQEQDVDADQVEGYIQRGAKVKGTP